MVALVEAVVPGGVFQWRSVTLKWHPGTPWDTAQVCCTVEMDFLLSVCHLSVRTSRKSLCEMMERNVFWGMEEEVGPALCKLS